MPFVPFTKKSAGSEDSTTASAAPAFSKKKAFGKARKRKPGKVAPAQKALMNPGGRSMAGGGR